MKKTPPTGNPNCTQYVVDALAIQALIIQKMEESSKGFNGLDCGNGDPEDDNNVIMDISNRDIGGMEGDLFDNDNAGNVDYPRDSPQ